MAERTTPAQRLWFLVQHTAGRTYREIADAGHVSLMCVRYWCRRLGKGRAPETHDRRPAGGLLQSFHPIVRYVLLRLRLEHPRWGPAVLRYHLSRRPSLVGQRVPSPASIGAYVHQWPRFRRPLRPAVPAAPANAPTKVHEEWQIDYKGGIALADGHLVNIVDIRDPVGAVIIGSFHHPAGRPGQRAERLTFPQLRRDVRLCFAHWGTLPERIQTDNEGVFVGRPHSDIPSPFSLWLKGLGITHRAIHPGRPTENAAVERQHRTVYDYALVGSQPTVARLQSVLDQAAHELNQDVPSHAHGCGGQPPLSAHPDLLSPRRPFSAAMELALFDLEHVDAYLATCTWRRKVGKKGQVNLGGYHHKYMVGHTYAGQSVTARFDVADRHLVFYDGQGQEIRRHPAREFSVAALTGLDPWPDGPGIQQLPLPLDFTKG